MKADYDRCDYPLWFKLPYTGEDSPPDNPEEPLAGTWPLIFLQRDGKGWFEDPFGNPIYRVKDPCTIDWDEQLRIVKETLDNLTPEQQLLADYWSTGQVTKQITPIIDRLIDTYTIFEVKVPPISMSTPQAARILALVQSAISDAGVVTWAVKYRAMVARPTQQADYLPTLECTPRHPSYVSGHAVAIGVAQEILSYYFPPEKERLEQLANDCANARLFAGVHFPIDNSEGLKLGRSIGRSLAAFFSTQEDALGNMVDRIFTEDRNPILPPGGYPCRQAIPFDFEQFCQSATFEPPLWDKIKQYFICLFKC
ncbi:vanadium-dependent haloperoxidase [Bacillus infantis]|uniref:vanadium-dependent haloperoxidase n=1 Tax=Bacillus infantis TaxID=324767 RepID=UPI002155D1E0|nr:vanadium-dependent haloperoxidase [Bacillus infantis]MCR6609410.1 vanadium-dependent haloperoxidase [Bacillus infantis]